ncbi:hypothetical protein, partial [Amycolatopsis sulphurea]|uniref:hypothetical protein n=1 Tax=Amycolatopsis sulphurea TaxID=76022 RepID=UPI003688B9F3
MTLGDSLGVVVAGGGDTPKLLWCNVKTRNLGMNLVLPQINFIEVPRLMSVSYTATLPVRDQ